MQSTYTKRDVAMMALEEIALANYVFDGTAEEDVALLRRMDAMMASAPWSGIFYNTATTDGSSLPSDPVSIDDDYLEAVYTNLALRIAPTYGKVVSAETRVAASQGKNAVSAVYARDRLPCMILNGTTIRGQGNRRGCVL